MSAHHQDYVFQVTIHALWGYLLAGFSLFRLLTYFFLYVAPAKESIMPSRPPTEAMAAVSLACGGVVFVLSDEEITFAAMRHGWDDMMAFLNLVRRKPCLSMLIKTPPADTCRLLIAPHPTDRCPGLPPLLLGPDHHG